MQIAENVRRLCGEVIRELGFEIYDVVYKRDSEGMCLAIYIDGVSLEDCERISRAVEPILDKWESLFSESYRLTVSSLGLDWPVKTERDFARSVGKMVEVKLYSKQDGEKEFVGELVDWNTETVTIGDRTFNRKDIANIVPHIKF